MSTVTTTTGPVPVRARHAGFLRDLASVAGRALRSIPREPEAVIPALIVPLFFFFVNTGALEPLTESVLGGAAGAGAPTFDYRAFQLPVAILFAVTGVSRASTLVTDIQNGYFDRLTVTPIHRLALLLGLMVADFALVVGLAMPVVVLGLVVGVDFATGPLGIVVFVLAAGAWGLVFTGFPYAIALKTGNPAAVNSSFILFFPFLFLTTAFAPREFLSGWLDTAATYNPVTYLLDGLRALAMRGWEFDALARGGLAVLGVGVVSLSLALAALRGRVSRG